MITLYIKTHNKTGLKYFGKTTLKNVEEYIGSGKKWKHHIKKHGNNITTEIYRQFDEECDELISTAINFSRKNNIVKSDNWANLIEENGLDGRPVGAKLSKETKKKIGKRDYSINSTDEFRNKVSEGMKKTIRERGVHWSKGTVSPRKGISIKEEYGLEKSIEIRKNISDKAKNRSKGECKYCGKIMDVSNLGKYHNENCVYHTNKQKAKENLEKTLLTCPHCGKIGKKSGMKQWHFDNCKYKKENK